MSAFDGSRRVLGEQHPETLSRAGQVGVLLHRMGSDEEALGYLQNALRNSRQTLGNTHPLTLDLIENLGVVRRATGALGEAEALFTEALNSRRATLGADHAKTLNSMRQLVKCLRQMERFARAESICREALSISGQLYGPNDHKTLNTAAEFGVILLDREKYEEAETHFQSMLPTARRRLENKQALLQIITGLASTKQKLNQFEQAEPLFLEAYQMVDDDTTEPDRKAELRRMIAVFYQEWEQAEPNQGHGDKGKGFGE